MSYFKAQNKFLIMKKLCESNENYLVSLAEWHNDPKTHKRQIGFLAQYLLDNICNEINDVFLNKKYK
jgi:hypothetical protein